MLCYSADPSVDRRPRRKQRACVHYLPHVILNTARPGSVQQVMDVLFYYGYLGAHPLLLMSTKLIIITAHQREIN